MGQDEVAVHIAHRHKNKIELRLSHYLIAVDGSVIPDPDVTIAVHPLAETIGVITYEDCFGFRRVHCDKINAFSPHAQRDLNELLGQWLTKLLVEKRVVAPTEFF
jgi:uncharacterized protein YqiB (DUF1249 family)